MSSHHRDSRQGLSGGAGVFRMDLAHLIRSLGRLFTAPSKRVRPLLLGGLLTAAMASCRESGVVAPREPRLRAEHLTPEVAAKLNAEGHFDIPLPASVQPGEVTREFAESLVVAYSKVYYRYILGDIEDQHQGSIDLSKLRLCPRAYYSETPYEPLAPGAPQVAKKVAGSHWLISMCGGAADPEIATSVAVQATGLALVGGRIVWDSNPGTDFLSVGVPPSLGNIPVSPEAAAELLATTSGRRIASVPALVEPGRPYGAQRAVWRIALEFPVRARGSVDGAERVDSILFVGWDDLKGSPQVFRPALGALPGEDTLFVPTGQSPTQSIETIVLKRKASYAGVFERAIVSPGN